MVVFGAQNQEIVILGPKCIGGGKVMFFFVYLDK